MPMTLEYAIELRQQFCSRRSATPHFLVMDGESYLELVHDLVSRSAWRSTVVPSGVVLSDAVLEPDKGVLAILLSLKIVVIPTDGIRMTKVVGAPWEESLLVTSGQWKELAHE